MTIQDPPTFSTKLWKKVSAEARNLVESKILYIIIDLLVKDPKKRLTLNQVMDHKWLKNNDNRQNDKSSSGKFKSYAIVQDK